MKLPKDDLAADLLRIIKESKDDFGKIDQSELMKDLTIYITDRDMKVFSHAYKLGKRVGDDDNFGKINIPDGA